MSRNMMNGAALLLCIAGLSFGGSYSLDDCIKAGLENSKPIKMVGEEIKKLDAQIMQAYGSAMPSLDFNTSLSHAFEAYSAISMPSMAGMATGSLKRKIGIDTTIEPGARAVAGVLDGMLGGLASLGKTPPNTWNMGLTLRQPIYAQGKVGLGLKVAKVAKNTAEIKYKMVQDTTRASITKTFYVALMAQKNIDIRQEALKLADDTHKQTVLKFQVGKASELDTLISRLSYESAIIDLQNASATRNTIIEALLKQTGIHDAMATASLSGEFPEAALTEDFNDALTKAQQKNQILMQLESTARLQQYLVDFAASDFWPIVGASASVSKIWQFEHFGDINPNLGNDEKVAVSFIWNLFDGAQKFQKVKQAKSDKASFEYTRKLAIDGIEIALRNSFEKYSTAQKQLLQSDALIRLSEKAFIIAKTAYEVGQMTLLDFQKRELDLANAKIARNSAQMAMQTAIVDLKVLMGEF